MDLINLSQKHEYIQGSEINVRILSVARSSELLEITGLLAMPKMIANRWVKSRKPPACFWNYSKLSISIFSIYRALAQPRICLSRYQSLRTISLLYEVVRVEGMKTCQKKQNKTKQTNKTKTKRKNGHVYFSLIKKCKTRDLWINFRSKQTWKEAGLGTDRRINTDRFPWWAPKPQAYTGRLATTISATQRCNAGATVVTIRNNVATMWR